MARAALAGPAYCALVFAAGFALGVVRVLILIPRLGEGGAVLFELPIILGISWLVCRRLAARFGVPSTLGARLVMGLTAFASLMIAESGLSVLAFGRTLSDHLAHYGQWPALAGLAGQIAFAAFPAIQAAGDRKGD